MLEIKNTYNFFTKFLRQFILQSFLVLGFGQLLNAQALSLRQKWEGQYDVRMIGSMVLQPAFVSSVSPVTVTGFLTDDILKRTGKTFVANNNYGAFPDTTRLLPLNVKNVSAITDPSSASFSFTCPAVLNSVLSYETEKTKVALVYADCDDDTTTFQSSWAYLDLGSNKECARIKAAYLYWIGTKGNGVSTYNKYPETVSMKSFPGGAVGGLTSSFNRVKFKFDNSDYIDLQAEASIVKSFDGGPDYKYLCYLDLTNQLLDSNPSKITVANVQSNSKTAIPLSGWSLVVIYTYLNCPSRQIVLFDGLDWIKTANSYKDYKLDSLQAPSTANFKSYLGLGVLDGENVAPEILKLSNGVYSQFTIPVNKLDGTIVNVTSECNFETLDFCAGGDTVKINPFATDQPSYRMADANGVPYTKPQPTKAQACSLSSFESLDWVKAIDGVSSSKITTYDEMKNTNGNKIQRMPDLSNTMGFDLHHFRLPQGAITNGASSANMRVKSGVQGGTAVFLSYIAIETLQPLLQLSMQANKQSVDFNSKEISYTLKIVNNGGKATNPNEAYIIDSLDNSIQSIKNFQVLSSTNGLNASLVTGDVQLNPLTSKKYLKINVLDSIPPIDIVTNKVASTDTVIIQFTAVIKDELYSLWRSKCRRTVKNSAWVYFRDVNNKEVSNISNGDACNLNNTVVPVQVSDSIFDNYDKRYTINVLVNIDEINTTSVSQLSVLKKILADSLSAYNLPSGDIELMTFYNSSGDTIWGSEQLDISVKKQDFLAVLNLGDYTCSETYNIHLYMGKLLQLQVSAINPHCVNDSTGRISISVAGGLEKDTLKAELYLGQYSLANPIPSSLQSVASVVLEAGQAEMSVVAQLDSLGAGNYTLITKSLKCNWQEDLYHSISLVNPIRDSILLLADTVFCEGEKVSITAIPTQASSTGIYNWEYSLDSIVWIPMTQTASGINVMIIDTVHYYRVRTEVGSCPVVSGVHKIRMIPQRTISISPSEQLVLIDNQAEGTSFVVNTSSDNSNLNYSWSYSTNDGLTWFPISSVTSPGKYLGYDSDSLHIKNYTLGMSSYKYQVETQDEAGCKANAYARLQVSGNPVVAVETFSTTCSYKVDGKALVKISKGTLGQRYKIIVCKGEPFSLLDINPSEILDSSLYVGRLSGEFSLDVLSNLATGRYSVFVVEEFSSNIQKAVFEIKSATPIVVSVKTDNTQLCINEKAFVYASLQSAPENNSVRYIWERSVDAANWIQIPSLANNAAAYFMDTSNYFRVTVYAGPCFVKSDMLFVEVMPTPKVQVQAADTGCFKYDLHNLQITEEYNLPDLKLSLHRELPKSAVDNTNLIYEDNYILVRASKVYARMINQNRCYGLDSCEVFIKPMDECYPIFVPDFFSPDGDGINDVLEITGLEEYENPLILIYNVSGEIVFRGAKDDFRYSNAWDGTYLGHKLPDADYWYYIKAKEIKPRLGHFSLKRRSR